MSDPLGLSIGTTNLVAARVGDPPVTRRSVLTISGQVLTGFVERVGDPVPMVTGDGSSYPADQLMVDALDALVGSMGGPPSPQLAVAVPAHWTGATLRALRVAMRTKPSLAPNGVPARLVSDAVTALTALHANPGLPANGVVALVDLGGGGTSITLADAASTFEPIETSRFMEFSGDLIDQALLAHVLVDIADAEDADTGGTAAVGSLTLLRAECRRVKEALSTQQAVDVSVDLPQHRSAVRVTRTELEALMEAPFGGVLAELDDLLRRNRIPWSDVSTVVAVGGGASIPMVTQRLSAHTQAPVVTTPQPALDAAVGAVLFAAYGAEADAATGMAPALLIRPDASTGTVPAPSIPPDAGTGTVPAAVIPPVAGTGAPDSATFRQLAWSQDDEGPGDPVPYMGEDYGAETSITRAVSQYVPPTGPIGVDEPRAWQRLPQFVFGLAAVAALVAVGGVAIALTSSVGSSPPPSPSKPPVTATPLSSSLPPPPPPPPPTTEAPQSIVTVTSEAPPPPPPETVTVERPAPTHTTTVTTTQPTTTTTTTTTTPPPPPPTTETTTTPPSPTMTTSYITVPFVPVPIPIQVPASPTPVPQYPPQYPYQQPQYPYQQPQYQQPQYPY
jgi:actin-like ATPase involved in cell morphogenesis